MYNLLSGLKDYFKRQDIVIDHPIFRIHCTFTTVLLSIFSMIITWTQFVGQPIRCLIEGAPTNVVNTYCWIMTTFTMPEAFQPSLNTVAHPGVAQNVDDDETRQKYYSYYQWVWFILFLQALLCYFPKWLWETWENQLMFKIVCGLNVGCRPEDEKTEKKSILIDYLIKHLNRHNMYAYSYWFCEVLCFVNVIFQMFAMDWFFKGDFMSYGLNVLTFDDMDQEKRTDNMVFVFPRVTKCTFRKYGPSSTIEKRDAICILPLNIVNEKTYIFLWFWFIILAVLCALVLVYRFIVIIIPSLRPILMHAHNRMVPLEAVESVSRKVSIGDWWLLYMLGRNVDPQIYRDVIIEFAKKKNAINRSNLDNAKVH